MPVQTVLNYTWNQLETVLFKYVLKIHTGIKKVLTDQSKNFRGNQQSTPCPVNINLYKNSTKFYTWR